MVPSIVMKCLPLIPFAQAALNERDVSVIGKILVKSSVKLPKNLS